MVVLGYGAHISYNNCIKSYMSNNKVESSIKILSLLRKSEVKRNYISFNTRLLFSDPAFKCEGSEKSWYYSLPRNNPNHKMFIENSDYAELKAQKTSWS